MGRWSMDSEKMHNNEYWSNRYIIESETLAGALAVANDIRQIEINCSNALVNFTKYRVSTTAVGDDIYQIISDNTVGARGATNVVLPLFCRVRVDFSTFGGGRPSRKYFQPLLSEAEQTDGVLDAGAVTFYNANYAQPLVAIGEFVDVDGQAFTSASVMPKVAMRQLRRGSKKKKTPIIP